MSSFDTRNNSALMKRAEQLRRWEESDTNKEPSVPKNEKGRKIKFSSGCVFLAACVAGDKDEVVRLLETGADINTANVDGLTALHQACIDDNLEMVEFLIEHGADINRQDNEGWTPLHATASCGFVSIARYLIENGADLTAINSDGELAIDLARNSMADYLQSLIEEFEIDCEKARQHEEQLMLQDAKKWLRSDASEADKPHSKTGATALHVAAAKGYTKVLSLLLAGRASVDKQDNDGWTPLHAAAHWGQEEACEMLVDAMADMDIRNYAGQTAIDVADKSIIKFLEELRANNKRIKRRPSSQIRISDTIENHIETPTKLIRVEVKSDAKENTSNEEKTKISAVETIKSTQMDAADEDAPWRRNSTVRSRNQIETPSKAQVPVPEKETKQTDSEVILRRTQSFENDEKFYKKYHELRARINANKANSCPQLPATQPNLGPGILGAVNTQANSCYSVQRSASLKDHRPFRKPVSSPPVSPSTQTVSPNTGQVRRSFVPPVRDEESETQRKAHAKRVRETRRSTQGVTLDEIKSAEELVKKKNLNNNNNSNNELQTNTTPSTTPPVTSTSIVTTPPIDIVNTSHTLTTTITTSTLTTSPKAESVDIIKDSISPTTSAPVTINTLSTADEKVKSNESTKSQITDEITATYTISAPFSSPKRNSATISTTATLPIPTSNNSSYVADTIGGNSSNGSKISASYTITSIPSPSSSSSSPSPSPQSPSRPSALISITGTEISPSSTLTAIMSPVTKISPSEEKSSTGNHDGTSNLSIYRTSNPNVPATETPTEEKEFSPLGKITASYKKTENVNETDSNKILSLHSPNNSLNNEENVKSIETVEISSGKATVPSSLNLTSIENSERISSPISSPVLTPDSHQQQEVNRIREKRSIFGNDTTNSLTLAEKLRNEANKYIENNRTSFDSDLLNKPLSGSTTATTSSSAGATLEHNSSTDTTNRENILTSSRKCDSTPSSPIHHQHQQQQLNAAERRPSWRLKFDAGSKFKLEDVTSGVTFPPNNSTIITSAPAVIAAANSSAAAQRRNNTTINTTTQTPRPVSAPVISTTSSTSDSGDQKQKDSSSNTTSSSDINISLRRNRNSNEDKENDKENDSRSAQAIQAIIQRRRKPKRRSTGVVHLDMDEIDSEKQDSAGDNEEKESGGERVSRSRLGSTSSLAENERHAQNDKKDSSENGEVIDYKALWEAVKLENDKLKQQLKKKDDELVSTKATVEKFTNVTSKNSLSELEKRERRAMERKLSEMEEELKHLDILKTENQRLKEENGALIRVISKLSK